MPAVTAANLEIANVLGPCGGVTGSFGVMQDAIDLSIDGERVVGYHELVHNKQALEPFEDQGVLFVDSLEEVVDELTIVVGSAHGNSPEVGFQVRQMGGLFVDSVCSLVHVTHRAAIKAREDGRRVLYIVGDDLDHDEVVGTIGQMSFVDEGDRLVEIDKPDFSLLKLSELMVTDWEDQNVLADHRRYQVIGQTTLNNKHVEGAMAKLVDFISEQQPDADIARVSRTDVCNAVQERQEAVTDGVPVWLSRSSTDKKAVLVVTDEGSKNGKGYAEIARQLVPDDNSVIMLPTARELAQHGGVLNGADIFVTASASTPHPQIEAVVRELGSDAEVPVDTRIFRLPDTRKDALERQFTEWRQSRAA